MLNKKDFIKINNYLWEIPKYYRADMRVPARVYVSEKMLEQALKDESIPQLINGCALPGIVKYGIAMPDVHEGYSVPIGFVGAIRTSDGIISPGACGFDINCLSPQTKVLLENSTSISIEKLENLWRKTNIKFVDFQKKDLSDSNIICFLKRYNNPTIYRIATESGEGIEATGNHPIQTKKRMKEARFLNEGDFVLIYPFKGVPYVQPLDEIIISEEDFKKTLLKLGKNNRGSSLGQILKEVKKTNIFPLKYNSWQLPYLLKIIGFIFGDGYISITKNGDATVGFNAQKEDLEIIRKDIEKIRFNPYSIFERKRKCKIKTHYREYKFESLEKSFRVGSFGFAALLISLGAPFGLKTHRKYRVPKWIFRCPLWQKRLFLASFFGAELTKPATLNKYNFYTPQFSVSKEVKLKESGRLFLKDVVKLLREFCIKTAPIVEVPGYQYEGKQGKTIALRLQIKERTENLIKFFETVTYEYNQEKQSEACLAVNYLRRKLKIVKMRNAARREIKRLYRKKGDFKKFVPRVLEEYNSEYITSQFLYRSIFKENSHGIARKRGNPRIAFDFPSFEEYKEKYSYGKQGLVWEEIEGIEKIPYENFVYDITINNINHNF
ncbi:MAG: hypothetical protein COT33_03245, partial [Candidatus Nealsonbacteria bacterium CG08_land_8_20_14_0_20_38_20]